MRTGIRTNDIHKCNRCHIYDVVSVVAGAHARCDCLCLVASEEIMASSSDQKNFIKELAPYAVEAYKELGKIYPSICIAMGIVESAAGTAKKMREHNAFFGVKCGSGKTATKYWSGTFFTSKTSEEYKVGEHTVIKAAFRSYKDMRQCVFNFYELLNSRTYAKVLAGVPYQEQMKQIKAAGYMTSSTEVNTVLSLISRYDLTKYDQGTGAQVTDQPGCESEVDYNMIRTIKTGSAGKAVRVWQTIVEVKPDGIFGQQTYNATIEFQKARGLKADGIVGAKTWKEALEHV